MSEWKEVKLGMLGNIITGKTPRTAIEDNYGGTIPFLTPSDDMSVKHVVFTKKTLSEKGVAEVKNCLLPCGAVCVSCIGSDLGKVVITTGDTITNQQINSIIVNENNNNDFVYYLLTIVGRELNRISKTSTAVPIINKSTFSSYEIKIPDLSTQQEIAGILSSLDAKIETNNKLNEKLEEMAQAIFKSWFVDFEPFKDKPFHETELGMIPEGWEVGIFEDIVDIVGGGTPSKSISEYYTDNGIAWITPKDLSLKNNKFTSKGTIDITELGYEKSSAKLMPKGSVLFSSRAPIGYITIAKNEICTNQGFKSAVPKKAGTAFVYYLLKNKTIEIENMATGSTFKEASGTLMKNLKIIIPLDKVLDDFEKIMMPIFEFQMSVEEQNDRLASLRDTLLPRLMSGELKV